MKTTITHPIYGRIEYDSGKDKVSVQRGDLAERIKWLLRPENERLLGHGVGRDRFIEACAVLGILFGAKSIQTTSLEEPGVKTIIESSIHGRITHDDETDRVSVQRGQLAERISWLLLIRLFQLTTSSRVVRSRLNPISGALLKQPDKHKLAT
jgi:hypothetical protein